MTNLKEKEVIMISDDEQEEREEDYYGRRKRKYPKIHSSRFEIPISLLEGGKLDQVTKLARIIVGGDDFIVINKSRDLKKNKIVDQDAETVFDSDEEIDNLETQNINANLDVEIKSTDDTQENADLSFSVDTNVPESKTEDLQQVDIEVKPPLDILNEKLRSLMLCSPAFRMAYISNWIIICKTQLEHKMKIVDHKIDIYTKIVKIDQIRFDKLLINLRQNDIILTEDEINYSKSYLYGIEGYTIIEPRVKNELIYVLRKSADDWGRSEHCWYLKNKGWTDCCIIGDDKMKYWRYIDIQWKMQNVTNFKTVNCIDYSADHSVLLVPSHKENCNVAVSDKYKDITYNILTNTSLKKQTEELLTRVGNVTLQNNWIDILKHDVPINISPMASHAEKLQDFIRTQNFFWVFHSSPKGSSLSFPEIYLVLKTSDIDKSNNYDNLMLVYLKNINNVFIPVAHPVKYDYHKCWNLHIIWRYISPQGASEYFTLYLNHFLNFCSGDDRYRMRIQTFNI